MSGGREVVVVERRTHGNRRLRQRIQGRGADRTGRASDPGSGQARQNRARSRSAQLVFGNVIHTEAKDMYFSRVACIKGGLPQETTALTVNRLCGSGMQAIVSAAQSIMLGDADAAVGGGAESMSRGGYLMPTLRWGQRMNDGGAIDMMVGALTDPFDTVHMGITAENHRRKMEDHARAAGRVLGRKPPPRDQRHRKGLFQGPDRADRTQDAQRHDGVRPRRASARRCHHRRPDQAARGVQEGRHGDGGQRLGHQRRRRRRGADGKERRAESGPETDGAPGFLRAGRRRPENHGHRPGAGVPERARQGRPQGRATWT